MIEKHKTDNEGLDWALDMLEEEMEPLFEKAKRNYKHLESIYKDCIKVTNISSFLNQKKEKYFQLAVKALSAYLNLKTGRLEKTEIHVSGFETFEVFNNSPQPELEENKWLEYYYIARSGRNKELLSILTNYDKKYLSEPGSSVSISVDLIHRMFEYFYEYENSGTYESLQRAKNLTDSFDNELKPIPARNMFHYLFIKRNIIKVSEAVFTGDEKDFNFYLEKGLEDHKAFWSQNRGLNKGEVPLKDDIEGFISWPLTALAAMAYDKGMKVEVESDYIPKFLVEGKFEE